MDRANEVVEIDGSLRHIGKNQVLFPEERWAKRVPFLITAYTLLMLLLGSVISNSSALYQHIFIYAFAFGGIFLLILLALLLGKSRARVIRINENDTGNKRE
jgi:hypothetical protein